MGVEEVVSSVRLDVYLAKKNPSRSRSFFQKLIESGGVEINGVVVKDKNTPVIGDEVITLKREIFENIDKPIFRRADVLHGDNIPLDIIYEDNDLVVINKQAGLVVHPACGHPDGTLVDALGVYAGARWKPYLAHRLDKDTTGVIVIAKNERARDILARQFKNRLVEKVYIAIVRGVVGFKKAVIDAPLGRKPTNRFLSAVGEGVKMRDSYTEAEKILDGDGWSALVVRPKTGRTHQIRAHFAFIKHPILGDAMYGDENKIVTRPLLHAYSITLNHPSEINRRVTYKAPLPEDMIAVVPALKEIFD